jgi:hypothetical protein
VIVPSPEAEGVAVMNEPLKAVPDIATPLKVGASYK